MAGLTPAGTPGVTDDPVLGDARDTPADNSHGVVVLPADTVEDTATIGLEGSTSLKVNSNGAGCNGGFSI
jgi:hypothetical protein